MLRETGRDCSEARSIVVVHRRSLWAEAHIIGVEAGVVARSNHRQQEAARMHVEMSNVKKTRCLYNYLIVPYELASEI